MVKEYNFDQQKMFLMIRKATKHHKEIKDWRLKGLSEVVKLISSLEEKYNCKIEHKDGFTRLIF